MQTTILTTYCHLLSIFPSQPRFNDSIRILEIGILVLAIIIGLALFYKANRMQQVRYQSTKQTQIDPLAIDLNGSWDRGELILLYQPQIKLSDETLVGVEALLRWQHPRLGLISPAVFIPIAERTGLILPLGAWAFKSACEQAAKWQEGRLSHIIVAVNVSAVQLGSATCAAEMIKILHGAGVAAERLVIEVTESTLIERGDQALDTLRKLNESGLKIAIDDFGTGYSSLSSLKLLPSRYLKIDRSFISDLSGGEAAEMIVRAVVGMGKGLGMRVIAEGVETADQAAFLKSVGCEKAQGFFYGHPQSPSELESWSLLSAK